MKFQDKVISKFQDRLRSQNLENNDVLCTTNWSYIQKEALQLRRQCYTRSHDCHSLKEKQNIKLDPRMK